MTFILRRNAIGKNGTTGRCANAGGIEQILQSDRDPVQFPARSPTRNFHLRSFRIGERLVARDSNECVQRRIQPFDPRQAGLRELQRRNPARPQARSSINQRQRGRIVGRPLRR